MLILHLVSNPFHSKLLLLVVTIKEDLAYTYPVNKDHRLSTVNDMFQHWNPSCD